MHRWVLLLLALVCCGCADKWLIYPSNTPRFAGEAQPRILVDRGRRIEVFVARSPGAPAQGPAAVYCLEFTGNSTRAEDIAEFSARRWGQRSVEVWVMNYPGFGNSDGPASLRLIWDSALFTYDRLKAQAGDRPIVVSGNSLGTTVALGGQSRGWCCELARRCSMRLCGATDGGTSGSPHRSPPPRFPAK